MSEKILPFSLGVDLWRASTIYQLLRFGVIDLLADRKTHLTLDEIFTTFESKIKNKIVLDMSLRAIASEGYVDESKDGFTANEKTIELALHKHSICHLLEEPSMMSWAHLAKAFEDTSAYPFQIANGSPIFDFYKNNQTSGEHFARMMATTREFFVLTVDSYDFSPYKHIVDVGGHEGSWVLAVNTRYQPGQLKKFTIFDLPHVLPKEKQDVLKAFEQVKEEKKVEIVMKEGDFFAKETLPTDGDLYMMKHILHDWSDENCVKILCNLHSAMPDDATLCLFEAVVPSHGDTSLSMSKWMALWMKVATNGIERTEEEWKVLFDKCGFELKKIYPGPVLSAIEAKKKA